MFPNTSEYSWTFFALLEHLRRNWTTNVASVLSLLSLEAYVWMSLNEGLIHGSAEKEYFNFFHN